MSANCAGIAGLLVGIGVGVGILHLQVAHMIQTMAAVLAAVWLSTALVLFWWHQESAHFGSGGVYWGFGSENVLYSSSVLAVAAIFHIGLGLAIGVLPWIALYRAPILAGAAGLWSAVSICRACRSLSRLRMHDA
jgi:hypothetical protein